MKHLFRTFFLSLAVIFFFVFFFTERALGGDRFIPLESDIVNSFQNICIANITHSDNINSIASENNYKLISETNSKNAARGILRKWLIYEDEKTGTAVVLSLDNKGCWVTGYTNPVHVYGQESFFDSPIEEINDKEIHHYLLNQLKATYIKEAASSETFLHSYELNLNKKVEIDYEFGVVNSQFPWEKGLSQKAVIALRIMNAF